MAEFSELSDGRVPGGAERGLAWRGGVGTRGLEWGFVPDSPSFSIVVAASFTADPLQRPIEFWQQPLQTQFEVQFAPFGQILQTLLDPGSLFRSHGHGLNVILFRYGDMGEARRREENARALLEAIGGSAPQLAAPLLVIPFDVPEPWWREIPNAWLLSPARIDRWYPVTNKISRQGEQLGAIPFTEDYFIALGTSIVRAAHAIHKNPHKVLALDCDNTLWQGICGEDGPEGVRLGPGHEALQRFALRQREEGMLLALCSKNNEADVEATFAAHAEFPLQLSDITGRRIDWLPKPDGLESLSRELSLGLDSFVFVDDNPREVSEVDDRLPEVLALALPEEEGEFGAFLEQVWAFDRLKLTEEDRRRAASYEGAQQFGKALHEAGNLEDFLATLELSVEIHELREEEIARAAQLTQRTNQFNFTTKRRSEADLRSGEGEWFTIGVRDRFGDYGLTGLVWGRRAGGEYVVENFLLSCRVLGRGVEHRVMNWVGEYAGKLGCERVVIRFEASSRNAPAAAFYGQLSDTAEGLAGLKFPVVQAVGSGTGGRGGTRLRVDYERIARQLGSVEAIRGAMRRHARPELATATENQLAGIWQDLLEVEAIEPGSNFFDLGGHSLKVVLLLMRIEESFGVTLGIEDVYAADTNLERMARRIDERITFGGLDHSEYTQILHGIESMTEEEALAALEREIALHADPSRG